MKRICEFCKKQFETDNAKKIYCCVAHYKAAYQRRRTAAKYGLTRGEYERRRRFVSNSPKTVQELGLTQKQINDVITAQRTGGDILRMASAKWTPAQMKFARKQYEREHGLWSNQGEYICQ